MRSVRWRLPSWAFPILPGLVLYVAAYLPSLIILFGLSFQTYVPGGRPNPALTLENYGRFLTEPYYLELLLRTLILSAIAGTAAVTVAYPLAYAIVRSPRLRRIVLPIVALSFFVSAILRLYGWLRILGRGGLINGSLAALGITSQASPIDLLYTDFAVVIGLADFAIPYAVLVLATSINNIDESLEHASQNLGATQWQTFGRVTLPLTFPGLIGAFVLAFSLSVSAVITPLVLGGGRVPMLASQVYDSMLVAVNYPFAAASVMVIMLVIFTLLYSVSRALRPRTD